MRIEKASGNACNSKTQYLTFNLGVNKVNALAVFCNTA